MERIEKLTMPFMIRPTPPNPFVEALIAEIEAKAQDKPYNPLREDKQ